MVGDEDVCVVTISRGTGRKRANWFFSYLVDMRARCGIHGRACSMEKMRGVRVWADADDLPDVRRFTLEVSLSIYP